MNRFTHVMALISLHACAALAMDCSGDQTARGTVDYLDLSGQTHVITGGDSGMGYETALALASAKANIILACRSHTKCPPAVAKIIQATGNKNVSVIPLDLSSFDSVRKCAAAIRQQVPRLDVLINNAGLLTNPKGLAAKTEDGFDRVYQVNFLGAELLIQELLPLLRESGGRVVNVASMVSFYACLFGNYVWWECTSSMKKLSKLAKTSPAGINLDGTAASNYGVAKYLTVFTTAELARREPNITAVCLHPGIVKTDLIPSKAVQIAWCAASGGQRPCPRTAEEGATTQTYLAIARKEELANGNGKYFDSCKVHNSVRDNYAKSHGEGATLAYQSSVYDMAAELIGTNEAAIEIQEKHEDIAVIDLCTREPMDTCLASSRELNFPTVTSTPTYSWNVTATLSGGVTAPAYDVVVAFQENLPRPFHYQIPLGHESGSACGAVQVRFGVGSKGDRSPLPCPGCHIALTFPECPSGWKEGPLLIKGEFKMGFFLIPGYEPTPNITVNVTVRGNGGRIVDLSSHQRPKKGPAAVIV